MDFSISKEQDALYESARELGAREVRPSVLERDASERWDPTIWKKMAAAGLIGAPFPEEYGGSGLSALDTCIVKEGFTYGAHDGGVALAWGASSILCGVPIWKLGTEAQKQKYLPKMCSGDWVGAFCLSEPGSGSDAASMKTRAEKKGDRYILNGNKMWITNGPIANHFIVTAVTEPGAKAFGISTFIVEKNFPGFRVGQHIKKMGMNTSTTAEIFFEDCEVPEENLLGDLNMGFVVTAKLILGWERSTMLAPALGGQRANYETAAAYAKERQQFGRPIAKFQAIRHMIADMKIRYEIGRNLIHRVAWHLDDHGGPDDAPPLLDAAIAKVYASEATQKTARDTIQVLGGNGFTKEYHVERSLRDSLVGTIGAGTSEIQRSIIARSVLELGF
jgi:alkylation response protein AidB-like acyl-CoA dehydrogenase